MAGTTGLEPAASAVTGQRSNQLNYVPLAFLRKVLMSQTGPELSNESKSIALNLSTFAATQEW
jgi:hypothetical protein